jgi:hypothetical protein
VLAWHLATRINGWSARAREIGSVAAVREDLCPSGDGRKVVFSMDTETGVGIFYLDTIRDEKPRLLCEQPEKGYSWQRFGMLGWSPDDRLFLCALPADRRSDAGLRPEKILVCSGATGRSLAAIDADPDLAESAWLAPETFACLSYNQDVTVYQAKSDDIWAMIRSIRQAGPGRLESARSGFTAISPTALAWCNRGCIWKLDINGTAAESVFQTSGNLVGFTRDLSPIIDSTLVQGQSFQPMESEVGSGRYRYEVRNQWAQGPGLWQSNADTGSARCVYRIAALRRILATPRTAVLTNGAGRPITCRIWAPPEDGRRHPLILAQTPYIWNAYAQVAAAEGCGFAMAERRYWDDPAIRDWSDDVMTLYRSLAGRPDVDTNRVYLYATSWESTFLSSLVERRPELWFGIILSDPKSLPDGCRCVRQLVIAGTAEPGERQRLLQYQARAYDRGIPLRLVLQKNAGHVPRSLATNRERTIRCAQFLHEDSTRIH